MPSRARQQLEETQCSSWRESGCCATASPVSAHECRARPLCFRHHSMYMGAELGGGRQAVYGSSTFHLTLQRIKNCYKTSG